MRIFASFSRRFWSPILSFAPIVGSAAFVSAFLASPSILPNSPEPSRLSQLSDSPKVAVVDAFFGGSNVFAQSAYGPGSPPPGNGAAPAGPPPSGAAPGASSTGTAPNAAQPAPTSAQPAAGTGTPAATAQPSNETQAASASPSVADQELQPLFQAPSESDPAISGAPLSLEKLLYRVASPFERRRRLIAYWDLAEKFAEYNARAQNVALVDQCVAKIVAKYGGAASIPPENRAALAGVQTLAKSRRETARLAFLKAQLDFDAAFSTPAARRAAIAAAKANGNAAINNNDKTAATLAARGTILYCPATPPTTAKYNPRFLEISRTRRLSSEAARLSVAFPLMFEALEARAASSKSALANLKTAFSSASPDELLLFGLLERYAAARAELLTTAIRYNQAIALYAVETSFALRGDAFLATLAQKPAAKPNGVEPASPATTPAPQNAAARVASAPVPRTFADENENAPAVGAATGIGTVRQASYAEPSTPTNPAPTPNDADLTPTPGARLEPADATAASEPAKPLAEASAPETPPKTESAPAETPTESTPQENAPTDAAPADAPSTETPTEAESAPTTALARPRLADELESDSEPLIIRGQDPTAAPQTPPQNPAPQASAQPAQNAQPPQSVAPTPNDAAQTRVSETTSALFAPQTPETATADSLPEAATTLREIVERVPATPSARAAVVRVYWRLQEGTARLAVERAFLNAYSKIVEEFNAKITEQTNAGTAPAPEFVASAGAFLAAAHEARARVAEARFMKRDAQIELARLTGRAAASGRPLPTTKPFCGPAYNLSAPPRANAATLRESVLIPEKLKAVREIGAKFGPPATLFSLETPSALDGAPLAALTTLEKKRESAILFIELVVSLNISIGEYVANFPSGGYVAPSRFVDALVGAETTPQK